MIGAKAKPAPRANAGSRIATKSEHSPHSTLPASSPNLATVHIAKHYRLRLSIAAVVARLAELGGAPS